MLALVLAASGIYGVLAYRTQLRTHEIGIRIALGAARTDVMWLILRQGLRLAALGIALGLVLTVALTRFTVHLLFGVSPADPLTIALVVLLLALGLFIASNLALGLTFSTLATNQMQAQQMAQFALLPQFLLSGFFTPFAGMPQWAQWIGEVFPTTHATFGSKTQFTSTLGVIASTK